MCSLFSTISKYINRFAIEGTSDIKYNALVYALSYRNTEAEVSRVKAPDTGVGEQPEGMAETLQGATLRAILTWQKDPTFDLYFAVENGVEVKTSGSEIKVFDFPICLVFNPATNSINYLKGHTCEFPYEAYEATKKKPDSFLFNTIGQTLFEMGLVKDPKDPHVDLCGVKRQEIIKQAFRDLLWKLTT